MSLGKRPRPPIRRTTSMKGITVDATEPSDAQNPMHAIMAGLEEGVLPLNPNNIYPDYDHQLMAMVSPRNPRGSSVDFMETPHFLRSCGLCKRRLVSGRDIYMYRGDTAFCSLECREQQMKQDETKEKMSAMASKKEDHHASNSAASKASSTKSQTVAAA
ncbi:hypothetical protein SLE2022_297910 [Rubroshorea leprosula]